MSKMFHVVKFDDNVKLCLKKLKHYKGRYSAKWKGAWYNVEVIFSGSQSDCNRFLLQDQHNNEKAFTLLTEALSHGIIFENRLSSSDNEPLIMNIAYSEPIDSPPQKETDTSTTEINYQLPEENSVNSTFSLVAINSPEIPQLLRTDSNYVEPQVGTIGSPCSLEPIHLPEENMEVSVSRAAKKKYYCNFCEKCVTNFGRHLVTVHRNEDDVIDILKYPKGNQWRLKKIARLRNASQFKYNSDQTINNGKMIVKRRPNILKNRTGNHYRICPSCKQMYSRLSLRVHYSKCTKADMKLSRRCSVLKSRQTQMSVHKNASKRLIQFVLAHCRDDKVIGEILYDDLCIDYGNKLCRTYRSNEQHNSMIRTRLREMGKFLIEVKKQNQNILQLMDVLVPEHYDIIVNAINAVAGYDEDTGMYRAPSTAYNLGLHIKQVAQQLQSLYIRQGNIEKRSTVADLICLMIEGFRTDINKTVTENQCLKRRHKKILLPTTEDINALKKFLDKGIRQSYSSLIKEFSSENYRKLCGFTLISLQLFNRKRSGEIERILIDDYKNFEFANINDPLFANVPLHLKSLSERYGRFFIRGKLNRQVPVIISKEHVNYINLILKHRLKYGISPQNPYVFGCLGKSHNTYLRACTLMRHFSRSCGAPNPTRLRGTELRKQIATACKLYKLPDPLIEDIANHLGHKVDIHKTIYRQSIGSEVPEVASILLRVLGENEDEQVINDEDIQEIEEEIPESIELSPSKEQRLSRSFNSSGSFIKTPWSSEEVKTVRENFHDYIEAGIVPTFAECNGLRERNTCIQKRTPPQIKAFVAYQTKRMSSTKACTGKKTWNTPEKNIVRSEFKHYLEEKKLPSLKMCKEVISEFPVLSERTPQQVKAYVNNLNRKLCFNILCTE